MQFQSSPLDAVKQAVLFVLETLREPGEVIAQGGYPALAAIIFIETGLMFPFLPGDSLLFVAGLYASRGHLSMIVLQLLLIPAAILGDATSYLLGRRAGPLLFNKPETRFFKPEHIKKAHEFYERHGGKAIVIARFVPIVRTFVPVAAGIAQMRYRDFALWNALGAALWIGSMTILGYFLGQFDFIGKNIDKAIIVIVLVSLLPAALEWWKARRAAAASA